MLRWCHGPTHGFQDEQKPRCPLRNRPRERRLAWRPSASPIPGLKLGRRAWGGVRPLQRPTRPRPGPGRRGRERGPAAWRADHGRPGYPVDPASLLEESAGRGRCIRGLQPGLVPGPRAGPHNSPCPRRLEIKRLTRRLCPSRSDKQFQVRSWAVEEGGDFQRQPQPQRDRELPENPDSAIFTLQSIAPVHARTDPGALGELPRSPAPPGPAEPGSAGERARGPQPLRPAPACQTKPSSWLFLFFKNKNKNTAQKKEQNKDEEEEEEEEEEARKGRGTNPGRGGGAAAAAAARTPSPTRICAALRAMPE
ncbi:hypothetical protein LEMLEM_LOCUS4434 [Lemmus lemmus]